MKTYHLKKAFGTLFGANGPLHAAPIIIGSAAATVVAMTSLVSKDPSTEEDPALAASQMQIHEERFATLQNLQVQINHQQSQLSDAEFQKHAAPEDKKKDKLYETAKTDMLGLQSQVTNLKSAFLKGVIFDPYISEANGQILANRFEHSFGENSTDLSTLKITRPLTPNNHGFAYLQECRVTTSDGLDAVDACMSEKAFRNDFAVFATGLVSLFLGVGGGMSLIFSGLLARQAAEDEFKRRQEEKYPAETYTHMTQKIVVREIKK